MESLRNLKVLSLEQATVVPYLTYRLAMDGMEVIRLEHPVYGELRGLLMVESRRDVKDFLGRVQQAEALLLSSLTRGVHLHTVECARAEVIQEAKAALKERGFLVTD
jgi:transcriptional regulator of NAD metabolism